MPPADLAPLRVVVADDDPLVRRTLEDALAAAGAQVVGAAADGHEAVALAVEHRPDVLLMDVVMPGCDGVSATRALQERTPALRVLLMTGSNSEELALAGLRAGASGFLRKDEPPGVIAAAVRRTAAGEAVIDGRVVQALVAGLRAPPVAGIGLRPVSSSLTDREWEVLDGLCVGLTPTELAAAFVVSVDTVRTHVKSIYRKLGVHSQEEAVAAAAQLRRPGPAVPPRPPGP